MPNNYYYLVASLSYLEFGGILPLTREVFLGECAKWLRVSDFEKLSKSDADELKPRSDDPAVIKEWKIFNRTLREAIAEARQIRKESLHEKYPLDLKDIFEEATPLLMEKRFEKKRWIFLEEKESEHYFDLSALIIYFLKLQILERLITFEEEKGKTVFESLCGIGS